MSIPLFFEPFPFGSKYFVDGGTISNFPAWTFDPVEGEGNPPPLPVLGFRLVPENRPSQTIRSFKQFASSVVQTALSGNDLLQTRRISNLHLINIPIPSRFSAITFELTAEESDELYFRGLQAADSFFKKQENRDNLNLPT
jgi:predicted acylesterase/phospholipase RssA